MILQRFAVPGTMELWFFVLIKWFKTRMYSDSLAGGDL